MKLKELLVQVLPEFGGWPDGVKEIAQHKDGSLFDLECVDGEVLLDGLRFDLSDDAFTETVTREQYESALAASQKVEWNGAGLPPVSCECEAKQFAQINWSKFKVVAVNSGAVFGFWDNGVASALDSDRWEFRPIRSEADKKRKETIDLMDKRFKEVLAAGSTEAMAIFATVYDTILAGKIPSGSVY